MLSISGWNIERNEITSGWKIARARVISSLKATDGEKTTKQNMAVAILYRHLTDQIRLEEENDYEKPMDMDPEKTF